MEDLAVGRTSDEPVAGSETVTEAPIEQRASVRSWGIDIGFGHVKIASSSGTRKFKSIFANALTDTNSFSSKPSYEFNGEEYYVGDDAEDQAHARIQTVEDIVTWAPLFVAACVRHSPDRQRLCIGLPVYYIKNDRDTVDRLKVALRSFRVNGLHYRFDVHVLSQGIGAANYHRLHAKEYAIADIGYNTIDLIYVVNGQPTQAFTLDNQGIKILAGQINSVLQKRLKGASVPINRVQDALEHGYHSRRGEIIKLQDEIEKYAENYTRTVVDQGLLTTWPTKLRDDAQKILFTGGGANFVRINSLSETIRDIAEIAKNPEYANALGFFKFAQSKGDK